jgi:hypothetical protein
LVAKCSAVSGLSDTRARSCYSNRTGHYGINTGKLTYGKISHRASVDLTAYDANPSQSECKVGASEVAYAWLTVTATHAVHFYPVTLHVDKSTLFNSGFQAGTYTFWAPSSGSPATQWGGSLGSVPPRTLTFTSPFSGRTLLANTLYCFSVAMP